MIKHSSEKPPNWDALIQIFPTLNWDKGIIVTYGDTYYSKNPIDSYDLIAHEETHMRQQEAIGIETWWDRYLIDTAFRLQQEVEAYKNQVLYLKEHTEDSTRSFRRIRMAHMARALSSDMYGSIISFENALKLIK